MDLAEGIEEETSAQLDVPGSAASEEVPAQGPVVVRLLPNKLPHLQSDTLCLADLAFICLWGILLSYKAYLIIHFCSRC